MKPKPIRSTAAAAAVICVLAAGGVSAVAAYRYLTPPQAAEQIENQALARAFESENAIYINEMQTCGGYNITLLGLVSGKDLEPYVDPETGGKISKNQTCAVLAFEKTDGTAMPEISSDAYDVNSLFASPYIRGENPSFCNAYTLQGGFNAFVEDGILYQIFSCDNLEMFADKGVYLGVSGGLSEQENAFCFDEKTGELTRNSSYSGVNALFTLPLDTKKADPDAAEAYLKKIMQPDTDDSQKSSEDKALDSEITKWMEQITPETIDTYAKPVASTRQILTPDKDGYVNWSYEQGCGSEPIRGSRIDYKVGETHYIGYHYSEKGLKALQILTLTRNKDGSVTFQVYVPKEA